MWLAEFTSLIVPHVPEVVYVTDLPAVDSRVAFVGPFQHHDVVVDGRAVRFLRATPLDGGQVHLNLDRRLGLDLTVEEADRFVPFLADCIAVALGYTCHPGADGEPNPRHPFPSAQPLFFEDDFGADRL